jgi:acyl-CoA thioesterase
MNNSKLKTKRATTIKVQCPNGETITSDKTTTLAIPNVPERANEARVFNSLKSGNLLSIGQLCDNDCTATFQKEKVIIRNKKQEEILQGPRDDKTGLWTVEIPTKNEEKENKANGMIRDQKTKQDLAKFHHASLGYPTKSTLIKAIKQGHLKTFPG